MRPLLLFLPLCVLLLLECASVTSAFVAASTAAADDDATPPPVVVRASPSGFAAFRAAPSLPRAAAGSTIDDVVRTNGANCRQAGFPSKQCDMCCNGVCCEDPSFWPAPLESVSLSRAQAWIPVRFAFIVPSTYNQASLPSRAAQQQLLGRVNNAFRYFPFRFLLSQRQPSAAKVFNDSALHAHCSTDPCFTDPNCGFLRYVLPNVSMDVHGEVVVTVCQGLGYLGEAQFPWAPAAAQYVQISLEQFASPSLVHELGHYVGLFHTFAGGDCGEGSKGDWVADTSAGKDASNNCGTVRDSCPGAAGQDAIKNFMNYGLRFDCGLSFTLGQAARAQAATERYRPRLIQATRVPLAAEVESAASSFTQTPGCAQSAETFEDCWCGREELDPTAWCKQVAPGGKLYRQQATWAPPPRDAGAVGVTAAGVVVSLLVVTFFV